MNIIYYPKPVKPSIIIPSYQENGKKGKKLFLMFDPGGIPGTVYLIHIDTQQRKAA